MDKNVIIILIDGGRVDRAMKSSIFTNLQPKSENQANQYRNWNPFYSKLAAALFNGLEIFPFKSDSKFFYSGSSSTTTLNHLLDIIDSKGIIYLQKKHDDYNAKKLNNLFVLFKTNSPND